MNAPASPDRYCGNCRNGYPGTPVENCTRCNDASGWEQITAADVARLRLPIAAADKRETCWLCTQPEICKANGFCSIERCDLPTLVSDEKPSDAPGAWTCKVCGFRGFWRGGAHCPEGWPR